MTTNWKITEMERQIADGGIIIAHYRVFLSEGDETVSAYGTQQLEPDPSSPDFVPYESLTEDTVVAWVKEALTDVKCSQIEGQLAAVLDQKLNPTTSVGRPWVPEPVVEEAETEEAQE